MDDRRMLLLSILYRLVRCLLGLTAVLVRRDLSKDAELLVLRPENTVLRRQVARVHYTPADRVWLAALSHLVPRRRWAELFPVTPATLLTWHRKAVLALDFVHVDTVFLTRIYALIAVEHGSRRAHLAGVTAHPSGAWTAQVARNLMMDLGEWATSIKFLLRDRDSQSTKAFDAAFTADSIQILTSPPRAPRANAICERMIGTLRRELLDRILIVNERHLRRILTVYLHHFNAARPHRTLAQLAPAQAETTHPQAINLANFQIRRKPILDGLANEHQLAA